ncbi:unnamed protein product [Pleuronectes platessa]|uniref:Uncharacterized protein n=1 Tax=Pleuronectes platessa TaxID=8262 RepID=A0A9N7VI05_PLEPL|nr:unnamed protein product [Pleuronectes platessa]
MGTHSLEVNTGPLLIVPVSAMRNTMSHFTVHADRLTGPVFWKMWQAGYPERLIKQRVDLRFMQSPPYSDLSLHGPTGMKGARAADRRQSRVTIWGSHVPSGLTFT